MLAGAGVLPLPKADLNANRAANQRVAWLGLEVMAEEFPLQLLPCLSACIPPCCLCHSCLGVSDLKEVSSFPHHYIDVDVSQNGTQTLLRGQE